MESDSEIAVCEDGPIIPERLIDIPKNEHEAFRAVRQNNIDTVEKYLSEEFDVNTRHEEINGDQIYNIRWFTRAIRLKGYSLLHVAILHGSMEMLDFLLSRGADVNQLDENRYSAVSVAAAIQRVSMVDRLIKAGADLNTQTISGRTPLIQAITAQNLDLVRLLLYSGADPNLVDLKGTTPLNLALMAMDQKNLDILRALLEGGSNFDETNKMGATALMLAVGLGRHEAVELLLDAGADISKVDLKGKSVFHFARGTRMALILIHRGASVDEVDNQGNRALDWAAHVGHVSMLRLLLGVDCRRPSLNILEVPRVVQVMNSIPVFDTWIRQELGQPRELKRICRGAIREVLGRHGLPQIEKLPIPRLMKDFLLAKKIDLSIGGIAMERWQKTAGGESMNFGPTFNPLPRFHFNPL